MKAQIHIHMDNAAFDQAPASELGRILRDLASNIEQTGAEEAVLRDSNGNAVGAFCIKETNL